MDKFQAIALNKLLAERYGKYQDIPLVRLVWSSDRLEWRKSEFKVESPKGFDLDLGTVEDTRHVEVYNHAPNRWVLEILLGKDDLPAEFVEQKLLDYWGIWIFWDSKNQTFADDGYYTPIEPTLGDIDRMIYFARNNTLKGHAPTEAQLEARRKEFSRFNRERIREQLDEEIPALPNALVTGSAVFMDSTKQKGRESENVPSQSNDK